MKKINIMAKKIQIGPSFNEHAEKRLSQRLDKFFEDEAEAKITLQPNGDDTWIPYEAVIRGRAPDEAAAALGGILREDLGIPDERQVWVNNE